MMVEEQTRKHVGSQVQRNVTYSVEHWVMNQLTHKMRKRVNDVVITQTLAPVRRLGREQSWRQFAQEALQGRE